MRKWGFLISLLYALILVVLLVPASVLLAGSDGFLSPAFSRAVSSLYSSWGTWLTVAILLTCQATLLFLPIDTAQRRLKPRGPVIVSCVVTSVLLAVLTFVAIVCLSLATKLGGQYLSSIVDIVSTVLGIWFLWGVVFYASVRSSGNVAKIAGSWLLKGSILELLIVIPCHIVVRRRGECSAPLATGFGITTGIAIMLLSFGPSVLLLYKKRLD